MITRRQFGVLTGSALASLALGSACRQASGLGETSDGRLTTRPRSNVTTSINGEQLLGLDSRRDAIIKLPSKSASAPLPLIVALHGAGQSAEWMLRQIDAAADEAGAAVLAPYSRDDTWDAVRDSFGPDVTFLNRALERVFDMVSIDSNRTAVGGFSDGATYAVSLGLINGDLFSHVLAFSPGFVIDGTPHGRPKFFISHGTEDPILPIDRCSRRIVTRLKERKYDVEFREFKGRHEVPADIARDGMRWVAGTSA